MNPERIRFLIDNPYAREGKAGEVYEAVEVEPWIVNPDKDRISLGVVGKGEPIRLSDEEAYEERHLLSVWVDEDEGVVWEWVDEDDE